jgi:hypothetical protein
MRARIVLVVLVSACGGRTGLDEPFDGGAIEGIDASGGQPDAQPHAGPDGGPDVAPGPDAEPDAPEVCDDFSGDLTPTAMVLLGTSCDEGENTNSPPELGCSTVGVTWEFVPIKDMLLSRVELWTQGGGGVALYGDANTEPGAELFSGSTGGNAGDPPDWRGADLSTPLTLHACHRYYVSQIEGPGDNGCSWATGGVNVREYTNDGSGWDGPYPGAWMAKFYGTCL